MEAVAYCRVSSKGQEKDGTGLDRQSEVITKFAKNNDYGVINIYKEAMTGTDAERPEFLQMLADLLSNGCRTIIIERLDRLARDLTVQMQLVGLLCSKGITLISADTGTDVTSSYAGDPMMKAMLQVQGVFSELDKSMLVNKLRKARQAKKEKTGCSVEGQKPFGSRPGESDTIDRIKQLNRKIKNIKRLGPYEIATILNKEKRPTRHGKPWSGVVVKRIIARHGWKV